MPLGQNTLRAAGLLLGISEIEMFRWEKGSRRIPPIKCPMVEAITGVPRELLRPDVYCAVPVTLAPELLATKKRRTGRKKRAPAKGVE